MVGPLEGITVIEVSAFIAAPYAGLTLAQMGAEVIRIDPIGGGLDYNRWPVTDDGASLYWAGLNKGKKSITLNVREPEGREIAHSLITASGSGNGIVLTNLPARGWLDYEDLKEKRDDLIMVNIVGSRDGSVALDYTVNARTGFPMVTGPTDGDRPVNHVLPVWDVVTGMAASNAVLVADRHRRDTGEGQYVRIALADSAFAVMSHLGYVAEAQINEMDRPATGNHVFGTFGCDFETLDRRRVMITAFTPRHWSSLLEATGKAKRFGEIAEKHGVDLAKEEERFALRDIIEAEMKPWFAERPLDQIGQQLDAVGACWGPYRTFREAVAEDPDLSTENPMFEEINQPGVGRYLAAGSFTDFGAIPRSPVMPAPTLGSDTEDILTDKLGLSETGLQHLRKNGVI